MKRIAIIGGGISGLSAAFAVEKHRVRGTSLEYALFEASPRFGGVLVTERVDGCLVARPSWGASEHRGRRLAAPDASGAMA